MDMSNFQPFGTVGYSPNPQAQADSFNAGPAGSASFFGAGAISGPATFSDNGTVVANSTTGSQFTFGSAATQLFLPPNYVSGDSFTSTVTFNIRTLADFGWDLTTNKVWTYTNSPSTVTLIAVPEPATVAMLAAGGVGLAGGLIRRRRLAAKA
jgi:hypothetical protein